MLRHARRSRCFFERSDRALASLGSIARARSAGVQNNDASPFVSRKSTRNPARRAMLMPTGCSTLIARAAAGAGVDPRRHIRMPSRRSHVTYLKLLARRADRHGEMIVEVAGALEALVQLAGELPCRWLAMATGCSPTATSSSRRTRCRSAVFARSHAGRPSAMSPAMRRSSTTRCSCPTAARPARTFPARSSSRLWRSDPGDPAAAGTYPAVHRPRLPAGRAQAALESADAEQAGRECQSAGIGTEPEFVTLR